MTEYIPGRRCSVSSRVRHADLLAIPCRVCCSCALHIFPLQTSYTCPPYLSILSTLVGLVCPPQAKPSDIPYYGLSWSSLGDYASLGTSSLSNKWLYCPQTHGIVYTRAAQKNLKGQENPILLTPTWAAPPEGTGGRGGERERVSLGDNQ